MEPIMLGQVIKPGLNTQPNCIFILPQKCNLNQLAKNFLVSINVVMCHMGPPNPWKDEVICMTIHLPLPPKGSELA